MKTCTKSDIINRFKLKINKEEKILYGIIKRQDIELKEQENKIKELRLDLEYEQNN